MTQEELVNKANMEWEEKRLLPRYRTHGFLGVSIDENTEMVTLPKEEFMPYMQSHLQFIKDNVDDQDRSKFSEMEYEKFRRVVDYMNTTTYSKERTLEGREDFYTWFTEYDLRRGTSFKETFPELINFYESCKQI